MEGVLLNHPTIGWNVVLHPKLVSSDRIASRFVQMPDDFGFAAVFIPAFLPTAPFQT